MCKMLANALLFLLPAVVNGGITIDIVTSSNLSYGSVSFQGEINEIIPDEERTTWGLSDDQLKDYVQKYRGPERPDDCLIKSPTDSYDLIKPALYSKVERILKPTSAKVLYILASEPELVYTNNIYNNGTATSYTTPSFFHKTLQSFTSVWTKNGELKIGHPISYSVNMLGDDPDAGPGRIDYKSKWGEDTMQPKTIAIGSRYDITLPIKPGQEVETSVVLQRTTLIVQVNYAATLDGYVACNYNSTNSSLVTIRPYRIKNVFNSNKLPSTINSTERISISFISKMLMSYWITEFQSTSFHISDA